MLGEEPTFTPVQEEPMGQDEEEEQGLEEVGEEEPVVSLEKLCKKKQFCFRPATDIQLLLQVEADRPFKKKQGVTVPECWSAIADQLNQVWGLKEPTAKFLPVNGRMCQRRFDVLLGKFKAKEMAALRASGTEEEYWERDQLLANILSLIEAEELQRIAEKDEKTKKEQEKLSKSREICDAALLTIHRKRTTCSTGGGNSEISVSVDDTDVPNEVRASRRAKKGTREKVLQQKSHPSFVKSWTGRNLKTKEVLPMLQILNNQL